MSLVTGAGKFESKPILQNLTKAGKLIVGTVGYPLLTIACAIGTLATLCFFGVAKAFAFFIPKQWSRQIDELIYKAGLLPLIAGRFTIHAAYQIFGQFQNDKTRRQNEDRIDCWVDCNQDKYTEVLTAICNAHINGSNELYSDD